MSTSETSGSRYLDPQALDKIKKLDERARLVVEGFITGQHRSPYNGFAIEFAAHREYAPGDDLRHIDWKVWSKTDRLYIKEYEYGNQENHEPRHTRKLLLKKQELKKLDKRVKERGFTIVPYRLYITERGFAKVEIALAQGKKSYDKRDSIKQKEQKRDLDRLKKQYG